MSCKHGNWPPCDLCDEEDAAHDRAFAAGVASVTPTRTEFEAAALPPLPEHIGEIVGRRGEPARTLEFWGNFNEASAEGRERKERVFTADQMHEFRRSGIAAHAAQTERERFEAAAYRSIRDHYCIVLLHEAFSDTAEHSNPRARLDEAMAAAMGWPTVPEVKS